MRNREICSLASRWYVAQCRDEWEHSYSVAIDTIDNPRWTVRIGLTETH